MARFLHVADVHLGFDRYDSKVRSQDFFYAFYDVLERYAVAEQVDFVAIAGDLFEHRNIQPATLNQAQRCLELLKRVGIPAIAIEGNHDNRPYGTKTNWLRYLSDWEQLILLEPGDGGSGEVTYQPWNPQTKRGGYIDLDCGVRVLGSAWYGATAPIAVQHLARQIADLPAPDGAQVMLFHHGLDGQIARYAGALRYEDLLPLKLAGIDYLALGHIHKNYSMENWIFNPGSIEANSIEESRYPRGAYQVEIERNNIRADLKNEYRQRPIIRLDMVAKGDESEEDIESLAIATVESAIQTKTIVPDQAPIVELRIEGQVGFDRLDLDVRNLQERLATLSGALIFLLKYDVDAVIYQSPLSDHAHRTEIEREVYLDLVSAHNTYKKKAGAIAKGLMGLKDLYLEGRQEQDLQQFVEALLEDDSPTEPTLLTETLLTETVTASASAAPSQDAASSHQDLDG